MTSESYVFDSRRRLVDLVREHVRKLAENASMVWGILVRRTSCEVPNCLALHPTVPFVSSSLVS